MRIEKMTKLSSMSSSIHITRRVMIPYLLQLAVAAM